jgi:TIR domain
MPQFASYARLKQRVSQTNARTLLLAREWRPIIEKSIFLSHKSEDDELVAGALLVLEDNGATVYVDHKDRSLDGASGVAVAGHLRKVIELCAKLVMLATPAAAHSKWIPWELGFADGQKQDRNVALFPVATLSPDMGWAEQEYLGLYQRIALTSSSADPGWIVWDHIHKKGMSLRDWISRPA